MGSAARATRAARCFAAPAALALILLVDPAAAFVPSALPGLRGRNAVASLAVPAKRLHLYPSRAGSQCVRMVLATEKECTSKVDTLPAFKSIFPAQERVIAVGDVHGDADALRGCLRLAKLIDDKDKWCGGATHLVQLGDVTDRGDGERECIDLLSRLRAQAEEAGGQVHVLLGNHEIMNADLDFRYVTPNAWKGWEFDAAQAAKAEEARIPGEVNSLGEALVELGWPSFTKARVDYFRPGGRGSKDEISKMAVALQIGDSVFVHGGLKMEHVRYGIERMNRETAAWLIGSPEFSICDKPDVLDSTESPMWLRSYSVPSPKEEALEELDTVLGALDAKRMVVGHTPQLKGINSAVTEHGREVWRCDTGMSSGMMSGPQEVLEILGDGRVRVITHESVANEAERGPEQVGAFEDVCDLDTGICTPAPGEGVPHVAHAQDHHLHPTVAAAPAAAAEEAEEAGVLASGVVRTGGKGFSKKEAPAGKVRA